MYSSTGIMADFPNSGQFAARATTRFTYSPGAAVIIWMSEIVPQTYTGKAVRPEVRVYDYKTLLVEKRDYTISYKNNVKANASDGRNLPTVTVTGRGNYTGKETQTFKILPKQLTDEDVTADSLTVSYTGRAQKPVPVVTWNGRRLVRNRDYKVTYPDARQAGDYTVLLEGLGNYGGKRQVGLTVTLSIPVSKLRVDKIADQTYTGSAVMPVPVVKNGRKVLTQGEDYTLSYQNNVGVGTATVMITGRGAYAGERRVTFRITAGASLTGGKAELAFDNSVVYTGEEVRPDRYTLTVSVKNADGSRTERTLTEGTDFTVSYKNNIRPGTATAVFQGINGYTGTLTGSYRIVKSDIGRAGVKIPAQIYTGREIRPDKELQVKLNGKALGSDNYEITGYTNNINRGTATVTIRGRNDCGGVKTVRFKIKGKGFRWWWK